MYNDSVPRRRRRPGRARWAGRTGRSLGQVGDERLSLRRGTTPFAGRRRRRARGRRRAHERAAGDFATTKLVPSSSSRPVLSLLLLKYASGDLDTSYDGNTKLTHNSRNWWAHAVADLAGFIFFVPWTLAWMPRSIIGVLRKGGIV